jgi:predicted DNA-binding transcriptional regulator AlpA
MSIQRNHPDSTIGATAVRHLSIRQTAEIMGLPTGFLYRLAKQKSTPDFIRIGRRVYVAAEFIDSLHLNKVVDNCLQPMSSSAGTELVPPRPARIRKASRRLMRSARPSGAHVHQGQESRSGILFGVSSTIPSGRPIRSL